MSTVHAVNLRLCENLRRKTLQDWLRLTIRAAFSAALKHSAPHQSRILRRGGFIHSERTSGLE